ncbi:alpha/beta fold hydrolase [Derxia lacustris]|uniref:alpha/beta fold hydrolase n=1 Tax=Derxia lacustris TaxID=764842 RepID=UPI000A1738EE|nr:alpha/beta fold hydrolase [Derxia lacustris]
MRANWPAAADADGVAAGVADPPRRRWLAALAAGALAAGLARLDPARASGVTRSYPAEPRPALPPDYGQPVELDAPDGHLGGSLLRPEADAGAPLVILVAGSGPIDRDGNSRAGLRTDSYRQLAAGLARAGLASLRYDKRGVGESLNAVHDPAALDIDGHADDLARWIAAMRAEHGFARVIVAGHSEGALLATLAAQHQPVDGLALLCGTGRRIGALLRDQLAQRLDPAARADLDRALARLEAGQPLAGPPASLGPLGDAVLGPAVQPLLMSWMRHDPAAELAGVAGRVLIVHGSTDLQLRPADRSALLDARPDASVRLIDGMCHTLKHAELDGASQARAYRDASLPVVPELLAALARFARG